MAVNMRGCFFGAQAVAPHMMERGWGRIINTSSATFWSPVAEAVHYVAAKGGVIGLTRALSKGLGNHGVTVNTLVPGLTRTEQMDGMYPPEVFEQFARMRSIQRDAVPQDLVGTVLYLCSTASDFVTGQASRGRGTVFDEYEKNGAMRPAWLFPALDGKVAVITGGGGDIARHYARALAEAGAAIGLIDIKPDKVADAADVLTKAGHKALGLTADVGNKKQLQEAVDKIIDGFGGIDILVNNAGYATTIDFVDIPEEEFDKVLDANLKGAFLLSQLAVPSMKQRGGGKIVNLTSTVSKSGPGDLVHYVATKSGIIGMTRALASALGPLNINVNALAPGMVATEPIIALYPGEVLDRSAAGRSIQRWEYAEDLVGTLTFLCSPASDFMTGQTIFVDGGHVFD